MAASGPPVAPAFGAPEPEFAGRAEKFSFAAQGNGRTVIPSFTRAAPPLARQERTMRLISARHAALAV
ncbi:MAG TPA: hypothetical protein VG100_03860, partial [Xanthobacteraceae bacterium]|nr:hypothetical protein [Xanthobacteraceae bacterium]